MRLNLCSIESYQRWKR